VTSYKIRLLDDHEIAVQGDRLKFVDRSRGEAGDGDLLIYGNCRTVAHFWAGAMAAYNEMSTESDRATQPPFSQATEWSCTTRSRHTVDPTHVQIRGIERG